MLILEFMGGQSGIRYRLFQAYFQRVLPLLGRLISGDRAAYSYLPESVGRFLSSEAFVRSIEENGFEIRKVKHFSFGVASLFYAVRR